MKHTGSNFIFDNKITLCQYTEKPKKTVVLVSSLHHNCEIEGNGKLEIVYYYNSTKAGVDTLDQIVRFYSTRRKSKRWPMTIFYNLLDIIGYNSSIVYFHKYPHIKSNDVWLSRRNFMKDLCEEILELNLPDEPSNEPKRAKIFEKKIKQRNDVWCVLGKKTQKLYIFAQFVQKPCV